VRRALRKNTIRAALHTSVYPLPIRQGPSRWLQVYSSSSSKPSSLCPATAFAETVSKRGAVGVIAAPAPLAAPLAHVSSLTLTCAAAGWQRAHGDVTGLRVRVTATKSKVGAPGAEAMLLLRYPRPYAVAEVLGLPSVVAPALSIAEAEPMPAAAVAPG